MVRLITSDIDGTLLPYGQTAVPENLFSIIRRLRKAGVIFCPASGRQYHSLRDLFGPMADELYYMAENGCAVFGPGGEADAPILSRTALPREDATTIARDIMARPDAEAVISCERMCYLCGVSDDFMAGAESSPHYHISRVRSPEDIAEEILKVSAYCPDGPAAIAQALGPRWAEKYRMSVSGPVWLDFTNGDKGDGLRGLCRSLGISPEEVVSFGDNWNDEAMLALAGQPWLMSTADEALRRKFPRQCDSVLSVLETLLAELEA